MIRKILALAFMASFFASAAVAQTCSTLPNNLTNGTTADASQVMANFNYALGCVGAMRGYLGGLTMSNDGTSPNTVIDTATGVADSDDATTLMTVPVAFTKNANAAWAVGSGNGCLDTGSGLAASTWYHLFVIARTDTGVVDEICSTSATSPVLPTNYTKKRRIGSFKTNASSNILAFIQNGDEFLWSAPVPDVNAQSIGNTAWVTPTLTVPTNVTVNALINIQIYNSSGVVGLTAWPIGIGITNTFTVVSNAADVPAAVPLGIYVASGSGREINAVASVANSTYWISTRGWIDARGRTN